MGAAQVHPVYQVDSAADPFPEKYASPSSKSLFARKTGTQYATSSRMKTFLSLFPAYKRTGVIDLLRKTDYGRLDAQKHVYLDFTGGAVHAESHVRKHLALLNENVFGNPHSISPTSSLSTEFVEDTRKAILEYFHANPDQYVVIFTPNASGALKLVGESYPFDQTSRYLLMADNHNSVNGIREFAHAKGAEVTYAPIRSEDMHVDDRILMEELQRKAKSGHHLFAFPAQSNFSGVQHSLDWVLRARQFGWDVLVDATSFVPTSKLDINKVQPDFVSLSFYKMFGYPTGIGALIVRKRMLAKMKRPWFAGGTVSIVSVQKDGHFLEDGVAGFEDGTVNYAIIPAVKYGLELMESVGYDLIKDRVVSLTGWALRELTLLRHSTAMPLVRIYGPTSLDRRGGTIAMNFYDRDGDPIDYEQIEKEAIKLNISLRTGCFCNPGASEVALELPPEKINECFQRVVGRHTQLTQTIRRAYGACLNIDFKGAVRISFGFITNFDDVEAFITFAKSMLR